MQCFISYSTKDKIYAEKIHDSIVKVSGVKPWMAERDRVPGQDYPTMLVNEIKRSKYFILLLSENSNESKEVKKELSIANRYDIEIIPVRISDVLPIGSIEYHIGDLNWHDLFPDCDENLKKLVDFIRESRRIGSVKHLSEVHFKMMGYEVIDTSENGIRELNQEKYIKVKKNNSIHNFYIIPVYRKHSSIIYFKALEAELFWEYRNLIWTQNFYAYVNNLTQNKIDFLDDDIDDVRKAYVVDVFRRLDYNDKVKYTTKNKIIFYYYVTNPTQYKKQKYTIPLRNEKDYQEGEKLSNLFLNLATFPNWWAVGKDNFDEIPNKPYFEIQKKYTKVMPILEVNRAY